MRNFAHLAFSALVVCLVAPTATAGALPPAIGYTLYVDGVRVGHSGMKIARHGKSLHFESTTRVQLGPNVIELNSRTDADPATYAVRRFSFEGKKGGMPVAAHVELRGDSAVGWVQNTAADGHRPRSQFNRGGFLVFEDWVMDLEVLLALRMTSSPAGLPTSRVLFANSFLPTDVTAGFTGEVLVESRTRSMTARKLGVIFSGGAPFESHLDPATGIPVYLHFPGTRAEAFRDDFFGDNPVSRYPGTRPGSPAK